jgi:hypothetical protein
MVTFASSTPRCSTTIFFTFSAVSLMDRGLSCCGRAVPARGGLDGS